MGKQESVSDRGPKTEEFREILIVDPWTCFIARENSVCQARFPSIEFIDKRERRAKKTGMLVAFPSVGLQMFSV